MWAYQLAAPQRLERIERPSPSPASLGDNEVLLRTLAGGICGSDIPRFQAKPRPADAAAPVLPGPVGHPLHEIVGEVVATSDDLLPIRSRVVGWASNSTGLAEFTVTDSRRVATVADDVETLDSVLIQPLACVLYALDRVDVVGKDVGVIGLGSIGLLFAHAARTRGARSVVGIDPSERAAVGKQCGVDDVINTSSNEWLKRLEESRRPTLCVEAVGHQTETLNHALHATRTGGSVLYFGIPDEPIYPFDIERLMRANLTLIGGVTRAHRRALESARVYFAQYRELSDLLVTHVFSFHQAQEAFDVAAVPSPDRIKVLIDFSA